MTRISNPFKVLGIDPGLVRKLPDEQLMQYVKTVYKALQMIYHPDMGGSEENAKEINAAMSELENPETFEAAKEGYLKHTSASAKMLDLEQQLLDADNVLRDLKQKYSKRFGQFVTCANGHRMCMVPQQELYLAMHPINIVRLKPNSSAIEVYDVFDDKFLTLSYTFLGFLNFSAELTPALIRKPHNDAFNFLYNPKSQNLFLPQELRSRQFTEEEFLRTWAPFMCADVTAGAMLLGYDSRNQKPYIIVGSVGDVSERFGEPFECYSARFLRRLHIRDTDSPGQHLRYAVEVAKARRCRNMADFNVFLDDIKQIVEDMRYSNPGKMKESTEKVVDKNLRKREYRWFGGITARKMAIEFLNAGKSYKGLMAALKCLAS